jgi:hypothetical protein
MTQTRILGVPFVCLAICSILPGCQGESVGGPVTRANYDKINADGSEDLAAAEAIMGGRATELPRTAWKGHTINPDVLPYRNAKLVKRDDNTVTVIADNNGSEAKVFRWGDDNRYIFVAVLDGKVVRKGLKEP